MTHFLHTDADLQAGLAQLILADPRLKPVADKAGAFGLRRRDAGFAGLCAIVCGQQLSTASAAAIRARLFAAFDPFHHDTVRRARADKLKRLGLSAPKIKSIREIGKAVAKGRIDLTKGSGPVTVLLGTDVGEVEGIVKKANGDPAARVPVTLIGRTDLFKFDFTDVEGKFHIRDVAPGEYKIFAWEGAPFSAPEDPEFRKPFEKQGVSVKMDPNGHQTVELTTIVIAHHRPN